MLIVFGSAKLLAELCERLGQPGIVGEIVAGVVIGPSVLGWIAPNDLLTALANLGAMFLLFRVGLEVKSSELLGVGGIAAMVATFGVVLQFFLSWGFLVLWGASHIQAIFVAGSLVATSVGITAHVLASRGLLEALPSKIIIAAAVIDDVEGLLVLAVVTSFANHSIVVLQLAITAALAAGFTIVVATWGTRSMSRILPGVKQNLRVGEAQFAFSMILLFTFAVLAVYAGVAAIVGAFLAGLALSEHVQPRVKDLSQGVSELLVPFFLAGIGLRVDLGAFLSWPTLALAGVLLVIAAGSKVIGCGLGAMRLGRADALRVGVGMVPRGEVGMVVAQIGLATGVLVQSVYSAIVFVAVATTLMAPPLLKLAFRGVVIGRTPGVSDEQEEAPRIG